MDGDDDIQVVDQIVPTEAEKFGKDAPNGGEFDDLKPVSDFPTNAEPEPEATLPSSTLDPVEPALTEDEPSLPAPSPPPAPTITVKTPMVTEAEGVGPEAVFPIMQVSPSRLVSVDDMAGLQDSLRLRRGAAEREAVDRRRIQAELQTEIDTLNSVGAALLAELSGAADFDPVGEGGGMSAAFREMARPLPAVEALSHADDVPGSPLRALGGMESDYLRAVEDRAQNIVGEWRATFVPEADPMPEPQPETEAPEETQDEPRAATPPSPTPPRASTPATSCTPSPQSDHVVSPEMGRWEDIPDGPGTTRQASREQSALTTHLRRERAAELEGAARADKIKENIERVRLEARAAAGWGRRVLTEREKAAAARERRVRREMQREARMARARQVLADNRKKFLLSKLEDERRAALKRSAKRRADPALQSRNRTPGEAMLYAAVDGGMVATPVRPDGTPFIDAVDMAPAELEAAEAKLADELAAMESFPGVALDVGVVQVDLSGTDDIGAPAGHGSLAGTFGGGDGALPEIEVVTSGEGGGGTPAQTETRTEDGMDEPLPVDSPDAAPRPDPPHSGGVDPVLSKGLRLMKFTKGGKGKPHDRVFVIDRASKRLYWGSADELAGWPRRAPSKKARSGVILSHTMGDAVLRLNAPRLREPASRVVSVSTNTGWVHVLCPSEAVRDQFVDALASL